MSVAQWKKKFVERLVELGMDEASASDCEKIVDVELDRDPEEAAEDEMSYAEIE